MLIQMVHFTFAPEDAESAAAMFRELREASRAEAGVVTFDVGRNQQTPNLFRLWEVYRDSTALDFHKKTDHYARLVILGVGPLAKERTAELLSPV